MGFLRTLYHWHVGDCADEPKPVPPPEPEPPRFRIKEHPDGRIWVEERVVILFGLIEGWEPLRTPSSYRSYGVYSRPYDSGYSGDIATFKSLEAAQEALRLVTQPVKETPVY